MLLLRHPLSLLLVVQSLTLCNSLADIGSKIYFKINSYVPCVQLANATHQIGCTSDYKGNKGIVYHVTDNVTLDWLINGTPMTPFVPLLEEYLFNDKTMQKLMKTKKMSGALVILRNSSDPTYPVFTNGLPDWSFSPDPSCPNDRFGSYAGDPDYGGCQKMKWNPHGNGMSMIYYGVPIFGLTDHNEIEQMKQCSSRYNYQDGSVKGYPVCGVEMKDFMFAAKDTPTCKRKSEMANPILATYCDPLGDYNVVGTLYPLVEDPAPNSVIMVATKLDSTSFFHDLAPGADNGVTGIVTLLAVARALGDYKRKMDPKEAKKLNPIVFTFFNGEVWDYIGSSRMVWDMENGKFPYPEEKTDTFNGTIDDATLMSKINLTHIGYFLEISQIGLGDDGGFFAHSDPKSQNKSEAVKSKVDEILTALKQAANLTGNPFRVVDRGLKQPLPPASLQRFLRKGRNIPGVVLADHQHEFVNQYYNSRFDNVEYLGVNIDGVANNDYTGFHGKIAKNLTKIANTIANAVYLLASRGNKPTSPIAINRNLTSELLYCMLYSLTCPEFQAISGGKFSDQNVAQPYIRYVSIADQENLFTEVIRRLLMYYTGDWLKDCTDKSKSTKLPKVLSYLTVSVRVPGSQNRTTKCVRGTSYKTVAVSPAFELKDFTSTEYSTWTESMWSSDMGVRMYLVADPTMEGVLLACGIVMTLCSFMLTYFFKVRCTMLFSPLTTPVVSITS